MTKKQRVVSFAVLGLLGLLVARTGYRWMAGCGAQDGGNPALVFDRIWVDRVAATPNDNVQVFVASSEYSPELKARIGAFVEGSFWKGEWELFEHERKNEGEGKLHVRYPGSRKRTERVAFHASECNMPGFEYCLRLKGNSRGAHRYYSREGWELRGVKTPAALRARVAALLGRLPR